MEIARSAFRSDVIFPLFRRVPSSSAQDLGLHVRPSDPPGYIRVLTCSESVLQDACLYRNPPKDMVGWTACSFAPLPLSAPTWIIPLLKRIFRTLSMIKSSIGLTWASAECRVDMARTHAAEGMPINLSPTPPIRLPGA